MARKYLTMFLAVVLGLLTLVLFCCWSEGDKTEQLVEDAHLVSEHLKNVLLTVKDVESGVRGYINTGELGFLRNTYHSETKTRSLTERLGRLLDDEGQRTRLSSLKNLVEQKFDWERTLVSAYQHNAKGSSALLRTLQGKRLMERIQTEIRDMLDSQAQLLELRRTKYHEYRLGFILAASGLSILGIAGIWEAIKLIRVSRRLESQQLLSYENLELLNRELNNQVFDLSRTREDLKRALSIRSEFLSKVSHELRTPLAGVIGATDLALGMPLLEEQRSLIKTAKQSGETLLALVNDILDFEKIELNQLQLNHAYFDLRITIQSALEPLRLKARAKGLAFSLKIADTVPHLVCGDRLRIQQVLTNLADNSIKFTDDGSVTITISLCSRSSSQAIIKFTVIDTGIGIRAESMPGIFEPFVQVDNTSARAQGGTGLGLSICRKLVDLMKGKFEATSDYGTGSCFSFTIPLELTPASSVPSSESPDKTAVMPAAGSQASEICILLVEDNNVLRLVTKTQLKRLGYESDCVVSGEDAFAASRRRRYSLILMDIQLPGIDGLEATKLIRSSDDSNCKDVPIVALTAHAMPGDREICLNAGMSDYIAKPVTMEQLGAVLGKMISQDSKADRSDSSGRSDSSDRSDSSGSSAGSSEAQEKSLPQSA